MEDLGVQIDHFLQTERVNVNVFLRRQQPVVQRAAAAAARVFGIRGAHIERAHEHPTSILAREANSEKEALTAGCARR